VKCEELNELKHDISNKECEIKKLEATLEETKLRLKNYKMRLLQHNGGMDLFTAKVGLYHQEKKVEGAQEGEHNDIQEEDEGEFLLCLLTFVKESLPLPSLSPLSSLTRKHGTTTNTTSTSTTKKTTPHRGLAGKEQQQHHNNKNNGGGLMSLYLNDKSRDILLPIENIENVCNVPKHDDEFSCGKSKRRIMITCKDLSYPLIIETESDDQWERIMGLLRDIVAEKHVGFDGVVEEEEEEEELSVSSVSSSNSSSFRRQMLLTSTPPTKTKMSVCSQTKKEENSSNPAKVKEMMVAVKELGKFLEG